MSRRSPGGAPGLAYTVVWIIAKIRQRKNYAVSNYLKIIVLEVMAQMGVSNKRRKLDFDEKKRKVTYIYIIRINYLSASLTYCTRIVMGSSAVPSSGDHRSNPAHGQKVC